MDVQVGVPDFTAIMREIEGSAAQAATDAMIETTKPALMELRQQTTSNGLGQRLANTWRNRVYPVKRRSLNPSGYIWSNAPDIADAFIRGATIRPHAGGRFLWIPTKNVPRARGSGRATSTKRMSPQEVQAEFNQDFVIRKGKAGRLLAFITRDRGMTPRGAVRGPRKGRLGHGNREELILMFTLTRTVQMPRLIDLKGPADRWSNAFVAAFARNMED